MGNHSITGKTSRKNQTPKILDSAAAAITGTGSNSGSNGAGPNTDELLITLIRLNLAAVNRAVPGDIVSVRWEVDRAAFEVYLQDDRLGTVPANHNSTLLPRKQHRGIVRVSGLTPDPMVIIQVFLTAVK